MGCKAYDGIGTLVPIEGNIDVPKYTKILNANLKPAVAKHFLENPVIFRTTMRQHTVPYLHESGKLKRKLV